MIQRYINFLSLKYGQSHVYPIFFARFLISTNDSAEVVKTLVDTLKDINHMNHGVQVLKVLQEYFTENVVKKVCEKIQMFYHEVGNKNSAHTEEDQKKIDVLRWVGNEDALKFLDYVASLGL